MGKARQDKDGNVTVELDLRRVLPSYVTIRVDGKPVRIQVAQVINRLAWGVLKAGAPHMVKGKKFAASKMDITSTGNIIITYYTPEHAPQKGYEEIGDG